jgi:hypothetical protein
MKILEWLFPRSSSVDSEPSRQSQAETDYLEDAGRQKGLKSTDRMELLSKDELNCLRNWTEPDAEFANDFPTESRHEK